MRVAISFPAAVGVCAWVAAAGAADVTQRTAQIVQAAEALRPKLIEQRRDFHMHPELSNREERTARVVAEQLRALGLDEIKTGIARHGVTALLKGGRPGPVVAVRADIDALPIEETLDVPYKSRNPGVKHACGHDVHTAVQLGVAEVLCKMRQQLSGSVKFIFQPAEEGAPTGEEGGAKVMVRDGVLENPRPLAIFGLHTRPETPAGQIAYHSGPAMAGSDKWELIVRGKMAHGGAFPHRGIDAVMVSAECITALQTIRSRRIEPQEPMVLTVGTINGGTRFNVIAEEIKMTGTLRTLNEEVRQRVMGLMSEILDGVTKAHGAKFELNWIDSNPITFNDPKLTEETLPTIRRVLGETNVVTFKPLMGSEDFSYYQKVVPGFFYFLGVGNPAKGITAGWHTAEFDVDEECLVVGVKVMANVLMDFLERHAKTP
jgi:amidohydrolase